MKRPKNSSEELLRSKTTVLQNIVFDQRDFFQTTLGFAMSLVVKFFV